MAHRHRDKVPFVWCQVFPPDTLGLEIFGIFGQVDQYRRRRKPLTAQEACGTADAGNANFSGINKPAPTKFPVSQIVAHGLNL